MVHLVGEVFLMIEHHGFLLGQGAGSNGSGTQFGAVAGDDLMNERFEDRAEAVEQSVGPQALVTGLAAEDRLEKADLRRQFGLAIAGQSKSRMTVERVIDRFHDYDRRRCLGAGEALRIAARSVVSRLISSGICGDSIMGGMGKRD